MRKEFIDRDFHCDAFRLNSRRDLEGVQLGRYDGVIVGGPVYAGRISGLLRHWVKDQSAMLNNRTCGFFTVSLNAADPRGKAREVDQQIIRRFCKETGLKPVRVASLKGALNYSAYNPLMRWIMQRISKAFLTGGYAPTYGTKWEIMDFVAGYTGTLTAPVGYNLIYEPDKIYLQYANPEPAPIAVFAIGLSFVWFRRRRLALDRKAGRP
jgi:menaquinone-dependent protoporphyrinogen IX oxidase